MKPCQRPRVGLSRCRHERCSSRAMRCSRWSQAGHLLEAQHRAMARQRTFETSSSKRRAASCGRCCCKRRMVYWSCSGRHVGLTVRRRSTELFSADHAASRLIQSEHCSRSSARSNLDRSISSFQLRNGTPLARLQPIRDLIKLTVAEELPHDVDLPRQCRQSLQAHTHSRSTATPAHSEWRSPQRASPQSHPLSRSLSAQLQLRLLDTSSWHLSLVVAFKRP